MTLLDPSSSIGPPKQFHSWHLLAAFRLFCHSSSPIGRYRLGTELCLGRGSVRSLVRFLRDRGLIKTMDRQGHKISKDGRHHCNILNQTLIKFAEVVQSSYTIDIHNFGCQLRHLAHFVTDGVQQRDAAIQAGASGATTFIQHQNPDSIIMPKNHSIHKMDLKTVLSPFSLEAGDVLIIGSGTTKITAQLGTLAASITLLKK